MFLLQSLPQIPFLSGLSQGWGGTLISPPTPWAVQSLPAASLPCQLPQGSITIVPLQMLFSWTLHQVPRSCMGMEPAWHPGLGLGPAVCDSMGNPIIAHVVMFLVQMLGSDTCRRCSFVMFVWQRQRLFQKPLFSSEPAHPHPRGNPMWNALVLSGS